MVCGIESATETYLDHRDVAALLAEIEECRGGQELEGVEWPEFRPVNFNRNHRPVDVSEDTPELRVGNWPVINGDPLIPAQQVRRDVPSGAETAGRQQCGRNMGRRSLPFAAGDVDGAITELGVAERVEHDAPSGGTHVPRGTYPQRDRQRFPDLARFVAE